MAAARKPLEVEREAASPMNALVARGSNTFAEATPGMERKECKRRWRIPAWSEAMKTATPPRPPPPLPPRPLLPPPPPLLLPASPIRLSAHFWTAASRRARDASPWETTSVLCVESCVRT